MKPIKLGSLWMLVAAFFFACMGALVKVASQTFSSNEVVFYRSLFGLLAILAMTRIGHKPLATPLWGKQIVRSLSGFGSLALLWSILSSTIAYGEQFYADPRQCENGETKVVVPVWQVALMNLN